MSSERAKIECYAVSDPGRVRPTNQDQYLIGDLAKSILIQQSGLDRPDQSRRMGWRNVLWSAIGGGTQELFAEVYKVLLQPGDALLLCSDGLNKHVSDEQIKSVLAFGGSPQEACRRLVGLANEGGGTDNVTVVIAAALPEPAPAPAEGGG